MKLEFSRKIFEESPNSHFHENASSGSRVVVCGQSEGRTDRQIDMVKLIVAVRNFAKACENRTHLESVSYKTLSFLHSNAKSVLA
jgi:hypothetical protein